MPRRFAPLLYRIALLLFVLIVWEVVARSGLVDPLFTSTPLRVLGSIGDVYSETGAQQAVLQTLASVADAFVIGTGCGLVIGTLLGFCPLLRKAYLGPITFLMSMPKIVFLPFFLLFFGLGESMTVAFGAFQAFFYVVVNVVGGVALVEASHYRLAQAFRARLHHLIADIVAPASLPGLFAALWHGLTQALGGVLIAELWSQSQGIGRLIIGYTNTFHTNYTLVVGFSVTVAAILVGALWSIGELRFLRWQGTLENSATGGTTPGTALASAEGEWVT